MIGREEEFGRGFVKSRACVRGFNQHRCTFCSVFFCSYLNLAGVLNKRTRHFDVFMSLRISFYALQDTIGQCCHPRKMDDLLMTQGASAIQELVEKTKEYL